MKQFRELSTNEATRVAGGFLRGYGSKSPIEIINDEVYQRNLERRMRFINEINEWRGQQRQPRVKPWPNF